MEHDETAQERTYEFDVVTGKKATGAIFNAGVLLAQYEFHSTVAVKAAQEVLNNRYQEAYDEFLNNPEVQVARKTLNDKRENAFVEFFSNPEVRAAMVVRSMGEVNLSDEYGLSRHRFLEKSPHRREMKKRKMERISQEFHDTPAVQKAVELRSSKLIKATEEFFSDPAVLRAEKVLITKLQKADRVYDNDPEVAKVREYIQTEYPDVYDPLRFNEFHRLRNLFEGPVPDIPDSDISTLDTSSMKVILEKINSRYDEINETLRSQKEQE